MNIAENWANISDNSYFSINDNQMLSINKDKKNTLTDVLTESASQLEKCNDKIDNQTLLDAADNANDRFTNAYSQANIFTKIFWNIMNPFGFSLVAAHRQFTDKIASKIAENYEGKLGELVSNSRFDSVYSDYRKNLIEMAAKKAMKNIENSPKNKGFIYTVTNQDGVTSYLIGTIHTANHAMTQNKQMIDAVTNSTELITEVGNSLFAKMLYLPINPFNEIRYATDLHLTNLAEEKGIKITALESCWEQITIAFKGILSTFTTPVSSSRGDDLRLHQPYGLHELIQGWQEGDENNMSCAVENTTPPSMQEIFCNGRTKAWSQTLIDKLKTTKTPISIAVGTAHCIGIDGLAQEFNSEEGLTVERI